ncbi:MAG: c-type cytochrome [Limnothrix sp.]
MMSKKVVQVMILLMVVLFLLPLLAMPGLAAETTDGVQIFEANCAGCHANGGNIMRRGKNLKRQAMEKHGYTSVEAITEIVTNGKGRGMSAFGDRLTAPEIQAVSKYVLEQSLVDWKS